LFLHPNLRKLTRGYFSIVKPEKDAIRVTGWMLRIDRPFETVELRMNGLWLARAVTLRNADVGKAFPWIPHAASSGFDFLVNPPAASGHLEVRGRIAGRTAGRLETTYRTDIETLGPAPPVPLMLRVTGSDELDFFQADGQRVFTDFVKAVNRHSRLENVARMLDWGCGCGRVTMHFLADGLVSEVHGSDIDGEAIAWCQQAFPRGKFQQNEPYPPLPFPDGYFDLVVAYSVFTHLDRNVQKQWLAEMRRLIAPEGLFLATVNGELGALYSFPERAPRGFQERLNEALGARSMIEGGIIDSIDDPALKGVSPDGYYRGVFQNRTYTVREWSPFFEILEYREAGVGNYQDLVVLRRRAD
jgi:SAM-dependent methyltransferase